MAVVKTILTVVFIIISVALTVIILMQESKSAGLGAIAGAADTYWGKNKGRSMEGINFNVSLIHIIKAHQQIDKCCFSTVQKSCTDIYRCCHRRLLLLDME